MARMFPKKKLKKKNTTHIYLLMSVSSYQRSMYPNLPELLKSQGQEPGALFVCIISVAITVCAV